MVDVKTQNEIQGQIQLDHNNYGGGRRLPPISIIISLALALDFILVFEIWIPTLARGIFGALRCFRAL